MAKLVIDDLQDVEDRFVLEECLGSGVCGKVYRATDSGAKGKKVAIKMQRINKETMPYIQEEYRVLQEFAEHPNLVDFYGVYRKVGENDDEVWFVLELCEGGPVSDLVGALLSNNRRMKEEHIAYILKEVIKALVHLHENRVMHRDVKASNVLLTKEGEVKLVDFGLCRHLSSTFGKSDSCIGSPCWMAPEVVMSSVHEDEESGYGNRADVWALGITAIELGDGKAPFQDMHPTRAMFQIVRNPPPTLYRPSNWTETFNDFINECLVKNPEHRPYVMEMIEHPFLAEVPENNYHLSQELKVLIQDMAKTGQKSANSFEALVNRNFLKRSRDDQMEKMYVEDLAALDRISEDSIIQELQMRMKQGHFQTFVGDILLILNPNEQQEIYTKEFHQKYSFKSRSDNAPHIFAIADSAYQDALHHNIPQNIVLAGESGSGKTTNYLHLVDHLLHLSFNPNINSDRIGDAVKLIHAFTHSATPLNDYSTRCVLKTEMSFGSTGKVSGAVFNMYQLEKWRVSSVDMNQSNYHILYYFYDGLSASGQLAKHKLSEGRNYRYLRIPDEVTSRSRPRDNPQRNVKKFEKLLEVFKMFEFTGDQLDTVLNVLAAILVIGDVRFKESSQGVAEVDNKGIADTVAQLLEVDEKKLVWALTNYCLLKKGAAVRRRHSCDESRDARDVLANMLYCRLVDYVVNVINHKLSYGRAIFGDKYSIRILDMFGFECFKENQLQQLFANTFNEQLHYHYLQRVFAWEALEMNEEDVPYTPIHYYNNKGTLDEILSKPDGVLPLIDDASRKGHGGEYILDYLKNPERNHLKVLNGKEFAVTHYTGKITYNVREMADKNRDFLPPEVIDVLRLSKNKIIKSFFAGKLTKTGNLFTSFEGDLVKSKSKCKLGSSSSEEDVLDKTSSDQKQFSQINKMRTAVSTFRSLCLELLKELSVGGGAGGTHFVRCVRSDLEGHPRGFHAEIVKQQLRAMGVIDTAKARQRGYPHRVSFSEFLRRYKFLAFDFDENVEVSKENCRLLLIRLKMEGWVIGKSKVFLKYYNEEYLARLYETQVKKIIKIQSMMRGFLTKIKLRRQATGTKPKTSAVASQEEAEEDKAARVLQKAYRGVASRKAYGPLVKDQYEKLDANTCKFIRFYCTRWRAKTLFQVLLQYRAARYQDLFNFSQQVHLYNQNSVYGLQQSNNTIGLDLVNKHAQPNAWLGEKRLTVLKLPFRLDEIPFFDTSYMCDPLTNPGTSMECDEDWDSPFQWRTTVSSQITTSLQKEENLPKPYSSHSKYDASIHRPSVEHLTNLPYNRDPNEPIRRLSTMVIEPDQRQLRPPTPPSCNNNQNQVHGNFIKNSDSFFSKGSCEQQGRPNQSHYSQNSTQSTQYRREHNSLPNNTNKRSDNNNFSTQPDESNAYRTKHDNNFNSRPANKDFDYVKSCSSRVSNSCDPIAELKNLGRRDSSNEDEPPFNFQGMLRKTNVNRESIKRTVDTFRKLSLKGSNNIVYDSRSNNVGKSVGFSNKEKLQLAPGIYVEGVVADL